MSQAPLQNPLPLSSPSTDVDSAILSRMSVRAYLPQAVEREKIAHILQLASRAPSGTNTQPWRVYVMQGASLKALTDKVCAAHDAIRADPAVSAQYKEEYDYYPSNWTEPYIGRRRENGWGLYGLLGIERGQKDRMHEQHQCNFRFFDAPVGLVFTVDRVLGRGSLLDYGMFVQNVMLGARGQGLHTCPQAAWNDYHSIILPHIGAPADQMMVCGMAMGYADPEALINRFYTPRDAAEKFTTWLD